MNDDLIVLTTCPGSPESLSVGGLELKKSINMQAVRQAVMELCVFGAVSNFPFVQFLTDLRKGGLVLYCSAVSPTGGPVVGCRVLLGMGQFWDFLKRYVKSVPSSWGTIQGRSGVMAGATLLSLKGEPKLKFRKVLMQTGAGPVMEGLDGHARLSISFREVTSCDEDDDDVAQLGDLVGFLPESSNEF